jgi:hypothetical protein
MPPLRKWPLESVVARRVALLWVERQLGLQERKLREKNYAQLVCGSSDERFFCFARMRSAK